MTKRSQSLRVLVSERLSAAAEEIFELVERTIKEYEEELSRSKEENQRSQQLLEENQRRQQLLEENQRRQQLLEENQRRQQLLEENQRRQQLLEENQRRQELLEENQRRQQLLEEVLSPRVLVNRTDVHNHTMLSPGLSLKQGMPKTPLIKTEPEEHSVKSEDEQLPECTAVHVKSEEHTERQEGARESSASADSESLRPFTSETKEPTGNSSDSDDVSRELTAKASAAQMETDNYGLHYNHVQFGDASPASHDAAFFSEVTAPPTSAAAADALTAGSRAGAKQECFFCQKRFSTKENLERHLRVHTGEKLYNCVICKRGFPDPSHLKNHMASHTGEKHYSCSVCGKTFHQNYSLNAHMKLHRGDKPYSCPNCHKTFSRKGNLVAHMRIYTDERPYSCSVCNKSFPRKTHLTAHLKTHGSSASFQLFNLHDNFQQ